MCHCHLTWPQPIQLVPTMQKKSSLRYHFSPNSWKLGSQKLLLHAHFWCTCKFSFSPVFTTPRGIFGQKCESSNTQRMTENGPIYLDNKLLDQVGHLLVRQRAPISICKPPTSCEAWSSMKLDDCRFSCALRTSPQWRWQIIIQNSIFFNKSWVDTFFQDTKMDKKRQASVIFTLFLFSSLSTHWVHPPLSDVNPFILIDCCLWMHPHIHYMTNIDLF